MLPLPGEMRELSERIRSAAGQARTEGMKRLLTGHAFRLAQVAEQLDRSNATIDAQVRRSHIERYKRLLGDALDERTRRTVQALLAQENAARDKEYRQIAAWRRRAEELRATAEQFLVPAAQEPLLRAAANFERMADHKEALLTGKAQGAGEKTG
jgi:hypothetical protein